MSAAAAYPPVSPYLLYEDAAAAVDWLCEAFGFRERLRYAGDDGVVSHAEAAGARISRRPADEAYGDRRYDCKDLEGHDWSFAQILRDVPAEEWGATQR